MTIRTRFAPSPTGSLHIGGARTALYNYLLAKKMHGEFILRIEDTDKARNSLDSLHQLLDELTWLGLHWDEGVDPKTYQSIGPLGPYQQSMRHDIYMQHAQILLQSGQAYYCFADEQTLLAHQEMHASQPQIHFQSPDRNQDLSTAQKRLDNGETAVIRYKNTHHNETFHIHDLVRGEIALPGHMIGDFVLLRADRSPVYNFCCAVDDCLMHITHVLRGEEHLPNTLRQLMIIDALGFQRPQYGHLSLILGEGNKKLSKRDGAASISDFQKQGYLPEGLLNALALLGWSDPNGREILNLSELEQVFNTDRLNPAAPHFDQQKLRWINHQHIQNLTPHQLYHACLPFLQKNQVLPAQSPTWIESHLPLFQMDLHTLIDICPIFSRLCDPHALLTDTALAVLQWPDTHALLQGWLNALLHQNDLGNMPTAIPPESLHYFSADLDTHPSLQTALCSLIETLPHDPHLDKIIPLTLYQIINQLTLQCTQELQEFLSPESYQSIAQSLQSQYTVKGKALFMPLRVAVLGTNQGLDLKLACRLIPLGSLIKRAVYALIVEKKLTLNKKQP